MKRLAQKFWYDIFVSKILVWSGHGRWQRQRRWRRRRQQRPFNSNENTKINWLSESGCRSERTALCNSTVDCRNDFSFFAVTSYEVHDGNECKCVHLQFKIPFSSIRKAHILCVRFVGGVLMARHISHNRVIWRWALAVGKKNSIEKRKSCSARFELACIRYNFWANEIQLRVAPFHGETIVAISLSLNFFSVGYVTSIALALPRHSSDCFYSLYAFNLWFANGKANDRIQRSLVLIFQKLNVSATQR